MRAIRLCKLASCLLRNILAARIFPIAELFGTFFFMVQFHFHGVATVPASVSSQVVASAVTEVSNGFHDGFA